MYQHELSDCEGYDLFRRAIVERSDEAWGTIYMHYRPLLLAWSRQSRARTPSGEAAEDLADRALARAWAALTPERFAEFKSLPALLGYLRTCVTATVIDSSRVEITRDRAYQKLESRGVPSPEQIVVDEAARAALWEVIAPLVASEREYIVLIESYVYTMAPRQILARYAGDFDDVNDVYAAKRNLLNRLLRSRDLQRLYAELCA
jgi:DNA-directed RNA polymerase specialized sigma24 family protein